MNALARGALCLPALLACGPGTARTGDTMPELQGEASVDFPPALFERGVSGTVGLRLFVDSAGSVVPESTALHRSSGEAAFDSAALAAAPRLQYTAGTRNGRPTGVRFVQDIEFRHPGSPDSAP
jgi:TonB family protein